MKIKTNVCCKVCKTQVELKMRESSLFESYILYCPTCQCGLNSDQCITKK